VTTEAASSQAASPRLADGIVLLDKPLGLSSNAALQRVKRLLRARRAGHAGTLDPLATGMLPIGLGQATKVCGALLGSVKAYRVKLALGAATATGDLEGEIVRQAAVPDLDFATASGILQRFVGDREQVPPMHAALKLAGTPLYRIARAGRTVERPARRIHVRRVELRAGAADAIEFDVECSKGTYVRVLGEEIAAALGTVGHLAALRRLWVEPFVDAPMVTLEGLQAWTTGGSDGTPSWWRPTDSALADCRRLDLDAAQARALRQGKAIELAATEGLARVYDPDGQFLGLVDVEATGRTRVRRFFVGAPPPRGRGGA
jgi:tRNA pseudouridine55 synthase